VQVVSAWKESSKLKDHKIEELNFQLGQAVTQLELARADAAALQQQLVDSKGELSSSAAALAAVQARAAAQLQALESQLASKESGLAAAEVRRQALEAELNSANSKVRRQARDRAGQLRCIIAAASMRPALAVANWCYAGVNIYVVC
jgi:chromosome segregation ATPase